MFSFRHSKVIPYSQLQNKSFFLVFSGLINVNVYQLPGKLTHTGTHLLNNLVLDLLQENF